MMLPLKENDRPIVKKLLEAGCCARCVLRFCFLEVQSAYRQPYEDTAKELLAFINDEETNVTKDSAVQDQLTKDPPSKKIKLDTAKTDVQAEGDSALVPTVTEEGGARLVKSDVCVVCLGVLQEFCDEAYATKVCFFPFHYYNLYLFYSFSPLLCYVQFIITTLSYLKISKGDWLHYDQGIQYQSKVWTHLLIQGRPCCFAFLDCSEKSLILWLNSFEGAHAPNFVLLPFLLFFFRKFPCPPTRPASKCVAQDVQCLHVSVFVAGRYNKFSRTLPQTPWVIDGERRMESSVEELIAAPLLSSFRAKGFNFSSSGREDVDVRTLGNGRPFALELLNPHRARFNKAEIRQLQETINQSSDKIRVRDLQIVNAMGHMKEGEEDKTKSYSALIWTQKAIDKDDITFLEETKELKLAQKTPLRVLHRRPLTVRERVIHTMSTRFLDAHHFHLVLRTQAGTYIKEFVHGDFGRTKPNLCDLLKTDTDILELDVESVDVDWPPPVPE
uniref:tRNA pseudouridine synthase Pus10 n=1 Tax=Esox lucius TaxID=8010 RepID=A0A3P8ZZI6_ESOLU